MLVNTKFMNDMEQEAIRWFHDVTEDDENAENEDQDLEDDDDNENDDMLIPCTTAQYGSAFSLYSVQSQYFDGADEVDTMSVTGIDSDTMKREDEHLNIEGEVTMRAQHSVEDASEDESPNQIAGDALSGRCHLSDTPAEPHTESVRARMDSEQQQQCEDASMVRPAAFINDLNHTPGGFDLVKFKRDDISHHTSKWAQQREEVPFEEKNTPKGAISTAEAQAAQLPILQPGLSVEEETASRTIVDAANAHGTLQEKIEPLPPITLQLSPTIINSENADASLFASASPPASMSLEATDTFAFKDRTS